jgi:16S rRNA (cytidine1402-2'-O)-methyltransferase
MSHSQSTTGRLFIVSTPIGNLADCSMRVIDVLKQVDLIAAEDTRITRRLLDHYEITTRMTSFHDHNARRKIPGIVAQLEAGTSIALVSDAGTPLISDPGLPLFRAVLERQIETEIIPGPSAILHALVGSGASLDRFTFLGFPPRTSASREKWVQEALGLQHTCVFYESPHRIQKTVSAIASAAPERYLCVSRELTKKFEEWERGVASDVSERILAKSPRGEYTVVLGAIKDTWPPKNPMGKREQNQ